MDFVGESVFQCKRNPETVRSNRTYRVSIKGDKPMNDLQIISSALQKAATYTLPYNKICVMISGGSDSDDMLAVLLKTVPKEKLYFLFCNTGIEMKETLAHISALEEKYGIKIEKLHVKTPIPISCKKYGQPFLEKYVSEMISRLQRHNFKWEDQPFDVLTNVTPIVKLHCSGGVI